MAALSQDAKWASWDACSGDTIQVQRCMLRLSGSCLAAVSRRCVAAIPAAGPGVARQNCHSGDCPHEAVTWVVMCGDSSARWSKVHAVTVQCTIAQCWHVQLMAARFEATSSAHHQHHTMCCHARLAQSLECRVWVSTMCCRWCCWARAWTRAPGGCRRRPASGAGQSTFCAAAYQCIPGRTAAPAMSCGRSEATAQKHWCERCLCLPLLLGAPNLETLLLAILTA